MGMTGFLTVPMYFGTELVKVTPMDFLRDTLLWAKLIDKYKGTMTAAPNFAYTLFAKRLRRQATPGQFDLSTLRWALSGAEQVDPADVEDLFDAGAPFGLRPEAILPAYGMAETTVAVSFTECGGGLVVDEVDADLLAVLHRAVPATRGKTRRLATLGRPLEGLEARIVDEDGGVLPARGVGVIQVRGEPVTQGYTTVAGFVAAQDDQGWYDTGDLGYLTENGHVVVCGRVKDVIIMAGRNIYPTDIERAAARVAGVRPGCAVAVRLDAGHSRETFAVAVESKCVGGPGRGAPHRASGGPRGGRRGRCPAPQRGCARAGNDPEDAVGQAAARPRVGARQLTLSGRNESKICRSPRVHGRRDVGRLRRPARSQHAASARTLPCPAGSRRGRPACGAERSGRNCGRRPRGGRSARRRSGVRGPGHPRRRRCGRHIDRPAARHIQRPDLGGHRGLRPRDRHRPVRRAQRRAVHHVHASRGDPRSADRWAVTAAGRTSVAGWRGWRMHSALALPLMVGDQVIGAINAYATSRDAFAEHAVQLGSQFAGPAAVSVYNAQLLASAHERTLQTAARAWTAAR